MKKQINLYFDFEFTSLSPDAQPISLGIVSDLVIHGECNECPDRSGCKVIFKECKYNLLPKSFYAEFTDFDINRCDEWVKENVVSKLRTSPAYKVIHSDLEVKNATWGNYESMNCDGDINFITEQLFVWLSHFSDYDIQFVCDCGTYDWYWMVQLLAEWDLKERDEISCPLCGYDAFYDDREYPFRTGLPKLPKNISPVPEDLNDLIRDNHLRRVVPHITTKDAFNADRETVLYLIDQDKAESDMYELVDGVFTLKTMKHNALWDAKVIKEIYQKLKR